MSSSCRSESSCEISSPAGRKSDEETVTSTTATTSTLSATTKTRLASLFNRLPKLGRGERKEPSEQEAGGGRRKDKASQSANITTASPTAGPQSVR